MPKTLYICYFGLRQPLVQTQVLPYLRELMRGEDACDPVKVSLLTFEPNFRTNWTAEKIETERRRMADEGIDWHCLGYHKWPSAPATAYDILRGTLFVAKLLRREKFDVLHGRVHIPTLMGAIARKLSRHKPKLLFDIRGFFPEEYTDAGVWPEGGWLYRSAKRVEKWLMKEADGFVVLTEKAREILFGEGESPGRGDAETFGPREIEAGNPKSKIQNPKSGLRPVEVIPCCVDTYRFAASDDVARVRMRKKLGVETRKVIAYVGSFGGWYMTDEMIDFFSVAREHDTEAFVLVLTQRDKEIVAERMRERGFAEDDFHVGSVAPAEIPQYLSAADIALSFIKACYSKQSSSPTKIAEYLACGVPIIANRGVGDVDELIEKNRVGVLIDDFSKAGYLKALNEIEKLGDVREKCRETAIREFDLANVGGSRYRRLYKRILD
jgi:glycosyltransferase involved in cell wall biosynthesis